MVLVASKPDVLVYWGTTTETEKGISRFAAEPRLRLVQGWTLIRMGRSDEARKALDAAIELFPNYVPLFITRVVLEFESGNRLEAAVQAERLLEVSPTHLYGSLIVIALALPEWGGKKLPSGRVDALLDDIEQITPIIEAAPPKIAVLGQLLIGRVNLLAGRYSEAAGAFEEVLQHDASPEVLAWYAVVVQLRDGPEAAIALLDKYPNTVGPEIYDIRAQCLLVHHRVDAAAVVIDTGGPFEPIRRKLEEHRLTLTHVLCTHHHHDHVDDHHDNGVLTALTLHTT